MGVMPLCHEIEKRRRDGPKWQLSKILKQINNMPKPRGKLGKLVIDNLVLLVCIPLIIGIHWGWASLQDVPNLVDPSEKRDLPILSAIRTFKYKLTGEGNPNPEKTQ